MIGWTVVCGMLAVFSDASSEAEQLFRERCTSCHVAPDAAFAVDRAWLAQIKDTA